ITQNASQADCGVNEYPHQGLCCVLCEAGTFVAEHCRASNVSGKCDPCKEGKSFRAHANDFKECLPCRQCNEDQITLRPCNRTQDAECQCKRGYSCADEDCQKCQRNSPIQHIMRLQIGALNPNGFIQAFNFVFCPECTLSMLQQPKLAITLCILFPLKCLSENLVGVVLQLPAEFPAAFGIMMCRANEYSHVQGKWEFQCLF
uniref:TNFR-Cys domain-containing protein n=1 Tax=Catharus ustulatus TaxID=91951 RepID=A0A8C3TXL3_CATUS